MAVLTYRQYGDLMGTATWGAAPRPGDTMVQQTPGSYTYAYGENLFQETLVLGSTNARHPAYSYLSNSTVKIDAGYQINDPNVTGIHYSSIQALGTNYINLTDSGIRPGAGGHISISTGYGSNTHINAVIGMHGDLNLNGGGNVTGEIISVSEGSLEITSAMLGAGTVNLDGNAHAEIGGKVDTDQRMAFMGGGDHLAIDHTDLFQGSLDLTKGSAPVIDFKGVDVDFGWYDARSQNLYMMGSKGNFEAIKLTPAATGFDLYKTAQGASISGIAPPDGRLILHVPALTS